MKLRLVLLVLFSSLVMAIYFGDNGRGYPKTTDYPLGYCDTNYALAYFNIGDGLRLKDSVRLRYQIEDNLLLSFEKKYISNKLAMGLQTRIDMDTNFGKIDIGIRNLGVAYADTNSPFGQEYLTYMLEMSMVKLSFGVQRMVNNGSDYIDPFLSARAAFLALLDLDVFYENKCIGIELSAPLNDQLNISLTGTAPAPNQDVSNFRNVEISFTWLMQASITQNGTEEAGRGHPDNNRIKELETKINLLQFRLNAVETLYSETFQQKLLNELLSQQLIDRRYSADETARLKETLQTIQNGTEFYYAHDYEHAYQEYKKADAMYPNLPDIHASLGSLYYVMGRWEEAKREWQLWLSLAPDSEDAKASLIRLQKEHPRIFMVEGMNK